ncbi:MAG: Hpt domain-containing protein [Rectinemataceae bacterium]
MPALATEAAADPPLPLDVWNRPQMLERMMGDEELARFILASFISETPSQIESVMKAVAAADFKGAQRLAHTFKGAGANLSCERFRAAASSLELACKAQESVVIGSAARQLQDSFNELLVAMRE